MKKEGSPCVKCGSKLRYLPSNRCVPCKIAIDAKRCRAKRLARAKSRRNPILLSGFSFAENAEFIKFKSEHPEAFVI